MRRRILAGIALTTVFAAGAALGAWQQAQTSASRREPQFDNEHVRVWKTIIMPNQPLALHRHEFGRTIVALKGGALDVVDGQGKTMKTLVWETGKAYWLDKDPACEMHGDMNRGKEPMEVIVVEMRR
jgi:hypothetical protein